MIPILSRGNGRREFKGMSTPPPSYICNCEPPLTSARHALDPRNEECGYLRAMGTFERQSKSISGYIQRALEGLIAWCLGFGVRSMNAARRAQHGGIRDEP